MNIVFAALSALGIMLIVNFLVILRQNRKEDTPAAMSDIAAVSASANLGRVKDVRILSRKKREEEKA